MNDESRKRLTGYLREKEQTLEANDYYRTQTYSGTRTFTTWLDLGALFSKIVEKGEWEEFLQFAKGEFEIDTRLKRDNTKIYYSLFIQHLFNPTRTCELVDRWLEGREKA